MKNASPIGIWKLAQRSSGTCEVLEPQGPVADRPVVALAGAHRPARLARADDLRARPDAAGGGGPPGSWSRRGRSARLSASRARRWHGGAAAADRWRPRLVSTAQTGDHLRPPARRDRVRDQPALAALAVAYRCSLIRRAPPSRVPARAAAAPARAGADRRPSNAPRAAGRTSARSAGRRAPRRQAPSCSVPPQAAQTSRYASSVPSTFATSSGVPATATGDQVPSREVGHRRTSNHEGAIAAGRAGHHDRQLHAGQPARGGHHRQAGAAHRLRRDALDLEPLEIGRRLLERLLDRQLERHRRRRAVRAAAPQVDPRDPVLQRQQLDVAAVGLHVRPHGVERRLHPVPRAGPGAGRGSAATSRPAGRRSATRRSARPARRPRTAPRRSARARRRTSARPRPRAPRRARAPPSSPAPSSARLQLLHALDELLGRRPPAAARCRGWLRPPSSTPSPWACASPCGPCRRPCTCARRTAGRDRTIAPRA